MPIRSIPTLVSDPAGEPVTLAEVKAWLKIDGSDDDALLVSLIAAGRESAEKYLRRALITQTWKLTVDLPYSNWGRNLPEGTYDLPVNALCGDLPQEIDLPYPPLQSISSVVTYDTNNASSTYDSANYFADTASGRMVLNDTAVWPSNLRQRAALVITYIAGYGDASAIPESIKSAIKMHIQRMYDERILCDMPPACESLLRQHRIYG